MKIHHEILSYQTKETLQFIDITDKVKEIVSASNIKNGLVNIQSKHTTAAVIVNENEPLLIKDLKKMLNRIAPEDIEYDHNNFDIRTVNMCEDECANGHSHCKHILLGTSQTLNIIEGNIIFGTWQRIFLIELDRSRPRDISILVMGK